MTPTIRLQLSNITDLTVGLRQPGREGNLTMMMMGHEPKHGEIRLVLKPAVPASTNFEYELGDVDCV